MASSPKLPQLRHHKSSNRGYVRVNGRFIYLGPWGAPETEKQYKVWLSKYLATGRRVGDPRSALTVAELGFAYPVHHTCR